MANVRRQPSSPEQSQRTIRVVSVIAATVIALSCGSNYAYSAWGPQFAERLELSATQQNLIGNAGNIGMYAMGIPGGILIDTKGPRWGVLVGCIALACGYFPLRAAYLNGPGSTNTALLCLFGLFTGVGSATAFSAGLKVSATNWPRHRGTATAFPLSAFGLSAFFWTTLAAFVVPDDTAGYLLLLACGTSVMVFLSTFFLQMAKPTSPYEALPPEERPDVPRRDSNPMHRSRLQDNLSSKGSTGDAGTADETSSLVSSLSVGPGDVDETKQNADHMHKPDITGWQLLRTPKFWQLFILLGLLCGVGLMTINNIGNDARSLWHHYDDTASHDFIQKRQLMHVAVLSLCQFFGRLCSGIGSDWLIHHHSSRIWALVASACIFTIAQIVALILENPNQLFWLSGLTGLAYGALFGVYPALIADAFGPSGMGINWGCMIMAPVIAANFFNLAYGSVLDKHSHLQDNGHGGQERICDEGRACYSLAYWITLIASVLAIGWSLWCIRLETVQRVREQREHEVREHEG